MNQTNKINAVFEIIPDTNNSVYLIDPSILVVIVLIICIILYIIQYKIKKT